MTPRPEKKSGFDQNGRGGGLAALIADILNSTEAKKVLADTGSRLIRNWSRSNRLKQGMARPMTWAWAKIVSNCIETDLPGIFEKPEHIEALAREMPAMADSLSAVLLSMAGAVEALPTDRKKALFQNLFAIRNHTSDSPLPACLARIAEDIYKDDPRFFSNRLIPLFESWIARNDFGEFKQLFDLAKSDINAFWTQAVGLLFEYPAKLIALLAFIPDAANLTITVIDKLLERTNTLPPDILTDLLLSLFKEVDAAALAETINRANEVIRQLYTGSTLIGEMDTPRFSGDLRVKLRTLMTGIDPALAIKARNALIDGWETLHGALIDAAGEYPDILNLWLHQLAAKRNSKIRLLKRKMDIFETLPEEDAVQALAAGLSSWNAYDLAETVNAFGRTVNRIGQVNPDLLAGLVTEFVNTLDLYELEEGLARLSRDLGKAVRPVFRMAAPAVINALCDFFEPGEADDGYDEAMAQARTRLRQLISGKENL